MNEFDNVNGFLIEKGEKIFNTGNRSFKYGDGIFETMKVVDNKVVFWEDHLERLLHGIKTLHLNSGNFDDQKWITELNRVITKNYYKFAKLRLTVHRESPGLYTPMSNRIGFVIEGIRYDNKDYNYKSEGITLGVFDKIQKPIDLLSNCKTTSALLYVMASLDKKEQELGDVVVMNTAGRVCETSNANIFYVKDKVVYTPALSEGCIAGVFRIQVIRYCESKKVAVNEEAVTLENLQDADEIFVTNVISGVQGVSSFQKKGKSQVFVKELQSFFAR